MGGGGRAGVKGGGVTGEFVTPHNFLGIMMMVALVLFDPAGLRTPRNRLWPFRQCSSRFWGFGCFFFLFATIQLRLG